MKKIIEVGTSQIRLIVGVIMRTCNSFSAVALLVLLACLMSVNIQAQSASEVEINDDSFQPDMLTVPVGTTVTWTNDGTTYHTVTSDDGTFHSGYITVGGRFSYLFDRPGVYRYKCNDRPFVRGVIRVTQEPSAVSATTSNNYQSTISTDATTDATQNTALQYSSYYQMVSEPAPSTHLTTPQNYDIRNREPDSLYFRDQDQAVPYSQYQSHADLIGNSLWIQGTTSWAQYAAVPKGAFLSLIAISPKEGNGYLYERSPDGQVTKKNCYFSHYSQIGFYADTVGQYTLSFSIDDQISNSIVIDVVEYSPSAYQQSSYPQQSYRQSDNQQTDYQDSSYNQPSYDKSDNQQMSNQPVLAHTENVPPAEYSSFWDTSAVKIDGDDRLTIDGIEGTDYDLLASNTDVLTRGLLYNGASYILVANPSDTPGTVLVYPWSGSWNIQNLQVKYGSLMVSKAGNRLQIIAPAHQSGLIIIPQQQKRYSFTVGPKPAYSVHAGQKPAYSFKAGPKPPYSFRIGY